MKQLEKDQLVDLVFDKCEEVARNNLEKFKQHISNIIKESGSDGAKLLIEFVTAYGNEMRKVCCQTVAEILHEVLYSE